MKPPAFDYFRPDTVDQALQLLDELEDAKVLAGGQSLIPMMNMRLARPGALIDINRIAALQTIVEEPAGLRIGALVRHYELQQNPLIARRVPLIKQTETLIGHEAIRSRGSIGGSLSHADPAAELPVLATLLDWEIEVRSLAESRVVPAREFFLSYLMTALSPNELVTSIYVPNQPAPGSMTEYAIRSGDFALAIAAVTLELADDGTVRNMRVALGGVADTPWRDPDLEGEWTGTRADDAFITRVSDSIQRVIDPPADISASASYRRQLAGELVQRALRAARAASQATAPGRK